MTSKEAYIKQAKFWISSQFKKRNPNGRKTKESFKNLSETPGWNI